MSVCLISFLFSVAKLEGLCIVSLYSEKIMSTVQDPEGIQIGDMNINNLRYADDTALIADSNEKLQKIFDRVVLESEKIGLAINYKKTYSLRMSRRNALIAS